MPSTSSSRVSGLIHLAQGMATTVIEPSSLRWASAR